MKTSRNKFSDWISMYYMWVIILGLIIFLCFSLFAPILMKMRMIGPAMVLYKIYYPFCHQLAFRSWFLFGQQPFYPRELADMSDYLSYEQVTGDPNLNLIFAREFIGNDRLGYKVTLCQRDIFIYSSLLLFALIFQISGKKIKTLPWIIWIMLGLIPIGIDGITQFGGLGIKLLAWLPYRESTPLLRSITGTLFGISTGWFLFPMLEESVKLTNNK